MLDRMLLKQGGETVTIGDVFSTSLYTGTGSPLNINNGINLSGKGGLVWMKQRVGGGNNPAHWLFDTARGSAYSFTTNDAGSEYNFWNPGVTFNSNGFNNGGHIQWNTNSVAYASWTFRKAPKFFDVVTWTGNGATRNIAHNLGIAPGLIIIKRRDSTGDWWTYHRSSPNYSLKLNSTDTQVNQGGLVATSTTFTLYDSANVNASGGTYIAYVFAHDTSATGLVQCGSYTAQVGSEVTVNLGWQPQFLIIKKATLPESPVNEGWYMFDTMRGITTGGDQILKVDTTDTEATADIFDLTATGFVIAATSFYASNYPQGAQYNYIAIRGST